MDPSGKAAVTKEKIGEEQAGQRLDNFLFKHLKGVPKSRIYRMLREGEVRVSGHRAKPEYKLQDGDEIRIPPVRVAEPAAVPAPGRTAVLATQTFLRPASRRSRSTTASGSSPMRHEPTGW